MNMRFGWQLFSMELRRSFAYRADFWFSFVVSTGAQFIVAWYLWKAIFGHTGAMQIGGYSFSSLMLYYLVVPVISRVVFGGHLGNIAGEIYQGTLTRYLIYPVSFFRYKLIEHCSNAVILMTQLLLLLVIIAVFLSGYTTQYAITPISVALGIVTMGVSAVLYFLFTAWVQLIAFWADQVWSLAAILRFITNLLGGSLIPLSMFPDTIRPALSLLPFSCFIDLPARTVLGTITPGEWGAGMLAAGAWILVFGALYAVIWHRGNRQYSGVGI